MPESKSPAPISQEEIDDMVRRAKKREEEARLQELAKRNKRNFGRSASEDCGRWQNGAE